MNTKPAHAPEEVRLLMIGGGPHATRFYLPGLDRFGASFPLRLLGLVELPEVAESLRSRRSWPGNSPPEIIVADPFSGHRLPPALAAALDSFVGERKINAVIVCTDPTTHRPYADWAITRGLHLLMDKPVSTRDHVVVSPEAARGLFDDFEHLRRLHETRSPSAVFSLCVHRRYHPAFEFAESLLREVAGRTGCPLTHYHAYHSDGQWRLPAEIISQSHHSYNRGHGKLSHSGFHFLDCITRMHRAGAEASGKSPDRANILATCLQPDGLLHQLSESDYLRLFGPGYAERSPGPDRSLLPAFGKFGEIDLDAIIDFEKDGVTVGKTNLTLLHNGFSRRCTLLPGKDLYKGNGRVKHEEHRLHVGPFLCIHMLSWQAKDKHDQSSAAEDFHPGGNNHFDIHVFRNAGIIGGAPHETFTLQDLAPASFDPARLFIEQVKEQALKEFLQAVLGRIPPENLKSPFSVHRDTVRLMTAVYQAISRKETIPIPWS